MEKVHNDGIYMNKRMAEVMSGKKACAIVARLIEYGVLCEIRKFVSGITDCEQYIVKNGYEYNSSAFDDLTAYECFCNELFFDSRLLLSDKRHTIHTIISVLKKELSKKFRQKRFCVIVSLDNDEPENITVQFHLYRDNKLFIEESVEEYVTPVLYTFFDTGQDF